ncbi:MAG: glycosyltransferase [Oscillospiraceae bacterium]|nr:glycosyltransferase [Oscillospiraceae bacterium]
MRVLILSCSTGGGHDSCAAALNEAFSEKGDYCKTVDSLSFVSENFKKFMSRGHSLMYQKFPWLFRFGYGFAEEHESFLEKNSPAFNLLSKGSEKLYDFIIKERFDAVICVHVFSGIVLESAFSGKRKPDIKTAFVATDYTCSPGAWAFDYDYYFIPDESLESEFTSHGIPEEKIIPCGIPVKKMFVAKTEKAEAKRICGVLPGNKHLLIMGGSMGCGGIESITQKFAENLCDDIEATVVCGNNKKLFKKLYFKYKNNRNIHIVGYSKDVSLLMESADLYLTKPGGISTTEAMTKALPMVLINSVSGCEKYNLEYFIKIGGAVAADSEEVFEKCRCLFENEKALSKLSENLSLKRKPLAAKEICFIIRGEKCRENLK